MILTLGQTAEKLVVTLNEKRTLDDGYYLFVFTHFTTKQVVTKIYSFIDDESDFQERYNQFEINTSSVFSACPTGQWIYKVYEQESSSNTNTTGLTLVERGIMTLKPQREFEYESYNQSQSFKAYNG